MYQINPPWSSIHYGLRGGHMNEIRRTREIMYEMKGYTGGILMELKKKNYAAKKNL